MKNLLNKGFDLDSEEGFAKHPDGLYKKYFYSRNHSFYNYLCQFINSRIGTSYNEAKNDFCKKAIEKGFTKTFYGKSLEGHFKAQFANFDSVEYKSYCSFIIQDGLITKNPFHPAPRAKKDVVLEGPKFLYATLNLKKVYKHPYLFETIEDTIGKDKMNHLLNCRISESDLTKLKSQLRRPISERHTEVTRYSWYWSYAKKQTETQAEHILNSIFDVITTIPVILKANSPEWKRYWATNKVRNKYRKPSKHSINVAHQAIYDKVMEKEKLKQKEAAALDIITRDRLGFYEGSFKGEFYHGQKRKKK